MDPEDRGERRDARPGGNGVAVGEPRRRAARVVVRLDDDGEVGVRLRLMPRAARHHRSLRAHGAAAKVSNVRGGDVLRLTLGDDDVIRRAGLVELHGEVKPGPGHRVHRALRGVVAHERRRGDVRGGEIDALHRRLQIGRRLVVLGGDVHRVRRLRRQPLVLNRLRRLRRGRDDDGSRRRDGAARRRHAHLDVRGGGFRGVEKVHHVVGGTRLAQLDLEVDGRPREVCQRGVRRVVRGRGDIRGGNLELRGGRHDVGVRKRLPRERVVATSSTATTYTS